mmetsp:Transcript_67818/g.107538  ORF Transcript_67818/g.107538 Transcript_67818/m.107538 type:complete len:288 (-) Transcript_67818:1367-2230(-)
MEPLKEAPDVASRSPSATCSNLVSRGWAASFWIVFGNCPDVLSSDRLLKAALTLSDRSACSLSILPGVPLCFVTMALSDSPDKLSVDKAFEAALTFSVGSTCALAILSDSSDLLVSISPMEQGARSSIIGNSPDKLALAKAFKIALISLDLSACEFMAQALLAASSPDTLTEARVFKAVCTCSGHFISGLAARVLDRFSLKATTVCKATLISGWDFVAKIFSNSPDVDNAAKVLNEFCTWSNLALCRLLANVLTRFADVLSVVKVLAVVCMVSGTSVCESTGNWFCR